MIFKYLLYGKGYVHLFMLDGMLRLFDNCDIIEHNRLYRKSHPQIPAILDQLVSEGLITNRGSSVSITLQGKVYRRTGGYLRRSLVKRLTTFSVILGIVAAIATVITIVFDIFL